MIVYIGVERGRSHFKMYHTTTKQERGGGREEKDCIQSKHPFAVRPPQSTGHVCNIEHTFKDAYT